MVEVANPFGGGADKAEQVEPGTCCPHMARLGVCLEPQMCFMVHRIPSVKSAEKLSTEAKEFNPFTAQAATGGSKEFNPEVSYQPVSQQAGVLEKLNKMGFEAQVDSDMRTVFLPKFEGCKCCKGFVNNCKGVECQSLGTCSCVAASVHESK